MLDDITMDENINELVSVISNLIDIKVGEAIADSQRSPDDSWCGNYRAEKQAKEDLVALIKKIVGGGRDCDGQDD